MTAQRCRRGALVGLLLLGCSCTETDPLLVDDIGVTLLFVVDPGLTSQNVDVVNDRFQVAEWDVVAEHPVLGKTVLDIGGAPVDVVFGDPCFFVDTIAVTPL